MVKVVHSKNEVAVTTIAMIIGQVGIMFKIFTEQINQKIIGDF